MRDMKFENFRMPLDLDLYSEECANATWEDIGVWMETTLRDGLGKVSCSWSVDRHSYVAAITCDKGKTTDAIRCTSMFGKTPLSALQKLLYLVEYCRWYEVGEQTVYDKIEDRTAELKEAFKKLSK